MLFYSNAFYEFSCAVLAKQLNDNDRYTAKSLFLFVKNKCLTYQRSSMVSNPLLSFCSSFLSSLYYCHSSYFISQDISSIVASSRTMACTACYCYQSKRKCTYSPNQTKCDRCAASPGKECVPRVSRQGQRPRT